MKHSILFAHSRWEIRSTNRIFWKSVRVIGKQRFTDVNVFITFRMVYLRMVNRPNGFCKNVRGKRTVFTNRRVRDRPERTIRVVARLVFTRCAWTHRTTFALINGFLYNPFSLANILPQYRALYGTEINRRIQVYLRTKITPTETNLTYLDLHYQRNYSASADRI